MEVKLYIDMGKLPTAEEIIQDHGLQLGGRIHKWHGQNVYRHMLPFMPLVSGATATKLTRVSPDGTEITTNTKYAGFLHGALLMVDPDTGSAWARRGVTKVMTATPLTYNTEKHTQAGGHWEDRMMAADGDKIVAELQDRINRG